LDQIVLGVKVTWLYVTGNSNIVGKPSNFDYASTPFIDQLHMKRIHTMPGNYVMLSLDFNCKKEKENCRMGRDQEKGVVAKEHIVRVLYHGFFL
jgi:hypothetical protein